MNIFSKYHPTVLLSYYVLTQVLLMTMQPLIVVLAFLGVIVYMACLFSLSRTFKEIGFYSVVACLIMVMYASFAHNGVTPLFFYNDHPITKEAIVRGGMLGFTVMTACLWFTVYTETMQTNHFLFLFTKIHPKLGIFASMLFRFFPYYKDLWQQNFLAHRGLHYFASSSRFERLGRLLVLHIHTLTQTIEDVFWKPTIMLSKGYRQQRTQFQLFYWRKVDCLVAIGLLIFCFQFSMYDEAWSFTYFPALAAPTLSPIALCSLAILYGYPAAIEGKELIKWHYLQSKM